MNPTALALAGRGLSRCGDTEATEHGHEASRHAAPAIDPIWQVQSFPVGFPAGKTALNLTARGFFATDRGQAQHHAADQL